MREKVKKDEHGLEDLDAFWSAAEQSTFPYIDSIYIDCDLIYV